jgi:hypothetical protein
VRVIRPARGGSYTFKARRVYTCKLNKCLCLAARVGLTSGLQPKFRQGLDNLAIFHIGK